MITVSKQVFASDTVIAIMVELPKSAVKNVKVFIREVLRDLVNVFFLVYGMECVEEVRPPNLPHRYFPIVAAVHYVKNTSDNGDSIFFLKFSVVRKKIKALLKPKLPRNPVEKLSDDN